MCLLCPFDFQNFPRNQVNVSEFYHRSWKCIVYRHAACGHFWIQKDYSMRMHIPCPRCYQTSTEPLAAFINLQEAQEYHFFVISHQQHEMNQLKAAQNMNEKIKFIEMTKPKDEVYYMGTKVTRPFMDGSFYEKWLNWEVINWPIPESGGTNQWINSLQSLNFGPKIDKEKSYKWDVPTSDMFRNISVWCQK